MKTFENFLEEDERNKAAVREELDELSNDLLTHYKKKASVAAAAADKAGKFDIGHKRFKGILKATLKQFNNDKKNENVQREV